MKKYINIIIFLFAIQFFCKAGNVVTGTVLLNGEEIKAEYTLLETGASLGSGRNACISQFSSGKVVVPESIIVNGLPCPVVGVSDVAFRLCTHITSVELPEGVERVGNFAFKGCRDLTKVTLPSTVETIGTGAFIDLPNLSDFFVKATTPPVWEYNDVFFFHLGGISDNTIFSIGDITLYVPENNKSDYRNALYSDADLGWTTPEGWGRFATIKAIEDYVKEPYAVYDNDNRTLTFYYDGRKAQHSSGVCGLNEDATSDPEWITRGFNHYIKKVVFTPSFGDARPTTTSKWFQGFMRLTTIEGMEYLNTSETTNMSEMFHGCMELTSIDLSHFDTSSCTDFSEMFSMCSTMQKLDLSNFDTSKATNMKEMFFGCDYLKSLDLSNFNTSKVTSFEGMFYSCKSLESLHVESFDASANDGRGNKMFEDCQKLKSILIPSSIKSADEMLTGCDSMEDVYFYGVAPFTSWSDNKTMLMPGKATRFHVLSSQVDAWTTEWPDANCTFVGDLGTNDSPLLLYTAADWNNLADLVFLGITDINAKMMADITCNRNRVVAGSADYPFSGTFDGNGHTLTLNLPDDINTMGMAPFCFVMDATIKNLVVDGTINGGIHSAGIVGRVANTATLTIENCQVKAYISARPNSSSGPHIGGFVGHGGTATITIKGCLFDGILGTGFNSDDSYAGAFIGWCESAAGKTVVDCYENGTYNSLYKHAGMNYDASKNAQAVNMTRCYSSHNWYEAPHANSITCGTEGLNIDFGSPTKTYDVSGISVYDSGFMLGDTRYAGVGETVSFTFDNPGYSIGNVKANDITPAKQGGALDGSGATYSFTLAEATDYVITADMTFQYIVLYDNGTENSEILKEKLNGEATNVQLKNRTIYMDGKWNTLCLPFDLTESQMANQWGEGYQLKSLESASFSNGTLTLNFKDTTAIEAGKPYIIKWEPALSANEHNSVFRGVTVTTAKPGSVKFELGDSPMGLEFKGVFNRFDIEGEDHSKLILGTSNTLFYPNDEMTVNAFRAYFELYGLEVGVSANSSLGDVNGDGTTNVTDVTMMVDYILGITSNNFIFDNADVNRDGSINVTDVTTLVDIILGNNNPIKVVTNVDGCDFILGSGGNGEARVGENRLWTNED
ncbi:MAG: leucine-rich repeat protein [Prevotella sp.]|nr:leucine-rich repeat protein [Prevotella sp.]